MSAHARGHTSEQGVPPRLPRGVAVPSALASRLGRLAATAAHAPGRLTLPLLRETNGKSLNFARRVAHFMQAGLHKRATSAGRSLGPHERGAFRMHGAAIGLSRLR